MGQSWGSLGRALATGAIAATAMLGAVGCGGGQSDEDQIRATIERLQQARADNDTQLACENITRRAHILIGVMGHDSPATCDVELDKVFRWMRGDPTKPAPRQPLPELLDARIEGDRATATVAAPGNPSIEASFVRDDGKWLLDSVFGTEVASFQRSSGYFERTLMTADAKQAAPVAAAGVSAHDGGRPCGAVDTSRLPELSGGCLLRVSGPNSMGVTSVFGTWRFDDRCDTRFAIRVDGEGRTWSRGFRAAGDSPCPDVKPCGKAVGGTGVEYPWRGRIARRGDGALVYEVKRACLNTCLGLFRGPIRMELVQTERGWRLETDKTNVGVSGWQFNDPLEARESGLRFEGGGAA
jgi:hypothetical protein